MENQPQNLKMVNVLLAEDDDATCLLLKELLSDYNINFIIAHNCNDVVSCINADTPLHLAILDLCLERKLDGMQLASSIRQKHPGIGLIIQTGLVLSNEQMQFLQQLNCELFEKPIDVNFFLWSAHCYLRQYPYCYSE
jgi:Response regulator containing CheY-like receiver, AAA-type ATPase, and DNA-binding domains